MKVFFIVDEFPFFLPDYLNESIIHIKMNDSVVGVTPLSTPKNTPTFYSHMKKQLYRLGPKDLYRITLKFIKLAIGSYLYTFKLGKKPFSVAQVADKHHIPIIYTNNVNSKEYLSQLRKLNVDVIVSSSSQIFKEELLSLPKIGCINRHSGLLPSYGGLFPIFHAMVRKEKYVGVSVHKMTRSVDGGEVLYQEKFKVERNDTLFSLYEKAYKISSVVTIKAIDNLRNKKYFKIENKIKKTHFSFPTQEDWNMFWLNNKKII